MLMGHLLCGVVLLRFRVIVHLWAYAVKADARKRYSGLTSLLWSGIIGTSANRRMEEQMTEDVKKELMKKLESLEDETRALVRFLDRHEQPCCECGDRRARNWGEFQAAVSVEGAATRLAKAREQIRTAK